MLWSPDNVVEFVFTDKGNTSVALHVRRGVVEYVPVPADYYRKSDFVLKLDTDTWSKLYLSAMSLDDAVGAGKVELTGNKTEMTTIFDLFDKFEPMKNFKLPPVSKVSVQHP